MTTRWLSTRLHISPRRISPWFKLTRYKRQLDFARAPRQFCFPSTPSITDELFNILSKLLSCLSHISRQTTHDVTDFRHSIDWEIEQFSNQLLISGHKGWVEVQSDRHRYPGSVGTDARRGHFRTTPMLVHEVLRLEGSPRVVCGSSVTSGRGNPSSGTWRTTRVGRYHTQMKVSKRNTLSFCTHTEGKMSRENYFSSGFPFCRSISWFFVSQFFISYFRLENRPTRVRVFEKNYYPQSIPTLLGGLQTPHPCPLLGSRTFLFFFSMVFFSAGVSFLKIDTSSSSIPFLKIIKNN
jgi:hypothetical protein